MTHHYTFSLFYWLLSNWNWLTLWIITGIIGASFGAASRLHT